MSKMIRTVIEQESQTHRLAQHGEGGSWRDSILSPEVFFPLQAPGTPLLNLLSNKELCPKAPLFT